MQVTRSRWPETLCVSPGWLMLGGSADDDCRSQEGRFQAFVYLCLATLKCNHFLFRPTLFLFFFFSTERNGFVFLLSTVHCAFLLSFFSSPLSLCLSLSHFSLHPSASISLWLAMCNGFFPPYFYHHMPRHVKSRRGFLVGFLSFFSVDRKSIFNEVTLLLKCL